MNLFHIEYFLAACRCKSINKASEQLTISRPAISKAIRDLEAEFGVTLLERRTTGIVLTVAGKIFYEKCLTIEKNLEELSAEMHGIRTASSDIGNRRIQIGLSYFAAHYIFPKHYPDFISRHPNIIVETREMFHTSSVNLLENNEVDVCIEMPPVPPCGPSSIGFIEISSSALFFCCHKEHRLANRESVFLDELKDESFICLGTPQFYTPFSKCSWTPNVKYKTAQFSVMRQMLSKGIYTTIQPREFVTDIENTVSIPIDDHSRYPIYLMWNNTVRHNMAFEVLLEYVNSLIKNPQ